MRSRLLVARERSSLSEELEDGGQVGIRDVRAESPTVDVVGLVQDEWVARSLF